jgi:hypothetical protein
MRNVAGQFRTRAERHQMALRAPSPLNEDELHKLDEEVEERAKQKVTKS